jgi:hypothetical protein
MNTGYAEEDISNEKVFLPYFFTTRNWEAYSLRTNILSSSSPEHWNRLISPSKSHLNLLIVTIYNIR